MVDVRILECLNCEAGTEHTEGPVTVVTDDVRVVWWTCRVCESRTLL